MSSSLQIFSSSFHGYNISLVRSRAVAQGITSPLPICTVVSRCWCKWELHRHVSCNRTGYVRQAYAGTIDQVNGTNTQTCLRREEIPPSANRMVRAQSGACIDGDSTPGGDQICSVGDRGACIEDPVATPSHLLRRITTYGGANAVKCLGGGRRSASGFPERPSWHSKHRTWPPAHCHIGA
ncbi:hypothetical protein GW17_00038157 [Ensete ventricosum]|nr:hypothetical protein GW17_00038157 [Ensete ventricosum]